MMSRWQVRYLHASVIAVTVTGAAFAFMKYAMKSDDPFAVINHPWQPGMLAAHVLAAPSAVFAFGWIFGDHIWPSFTGRRPNRPTGVASMLLIVPMALTGYLLQVVTGEQVHHWMGVAHWVSSGLFAVCYAAHLALKPRLGKRAGSLRPAD